MWMLAQTKEIKVSKVEFQRGASMSQANVLMVAQKRNVLA
jgi:hypothetical protein